jgi:hypothetical protein
LNNRFVRSAAVVFAVVLLAACASSSSQRTLVPGVKLAQVGSVPEMLVDSVSGLPVDFRVDIDNPAEEAVTLVSIEVEAVGNSGAYAMNRVHHAFSRLIPAKSSETVSFRAWVQPLSRDQKGDVSSPVMLRGTARFQTASGVIKRNFVSRGQ